MMRILYEKAPKSIQPHLKGLFSQIKPVLTRIHQMGESARTKFRIVSPNHKTESQLHREFVADIFDSYDTYEGYIDEFNNGEARPLLEKGLEQYSQMTGGEALAGIGAGRIGTERAADLYAIIREEQPEIIVETGVCNGVSSLAILLAVRQNGVGQVHSVDFPYRANEDLAEIRQQVDLDDFSGWAKIPADKDPGWIIPDELRMFWNFHEGKSQKVLPRLRSEYDSIDMFVHDSEHTTSCMLFEFELTWHWLNSGGLLLADDIHMTDAFFIFQSTRKSAVGKQISDHMGYFRR